MTLAMSRSLYRVFVIHENSRRDYLTFFFLSVRTMRYLCARRRISLRRAIKCKFFDKFSKLFSTMLLESYFNRRKNALKLYRSRTSLRLFNFANRR